MKKYWGNPELKQLDVCKTNEKATNPFCGKEVNIEGNGQVKCMYWTKNHQSTEEVCPYAKDKWNKPLDLTNNGNAYCGNYSGTIESNS